MGAEQSTPEHNTGTPEKEGAGLLLICKERNKVLLLLRAPTSGNPNTWGVPGGNIDPGETAEAAAAREAREEMSTVPEHDVLGSVLTRRGKRLQKHFTLFVCAVKPEAVDSFDPVLDKSEHTDFRWADISDVVKSAFVDKPLHLHPVPAICVGKHGRTVWKMIDPAGDVPEDWMAHARAE
ncbi:unnamed protein product [Pedinophyceae sp. YPF-701]|nr:unnamed protein product [Pedinophyceae sp. YPF-701]